MGQLLRAYLTQTAELDDRATHLLFAANRWERARAIETRLRAGTHIVCDRYAFSGVAFSAAKGLAIEWCKAPDRGLPAPDRVLYLELPLDVAAARGGFGDERYEKAEMQAKVKALYENALANDSWRRFDATRDIDSLAAQLLAEAEAVCARVAHAPIEQMFVQNGADNASGALTDSALGDD